MELAQGWGLVGLRGSLREMTASAVTRLTADDSGWRWVTASVSSGGVAGSIEALARIFYFQWNLNVKHVDLKLSVKRTLTLL